MYFRNCRTPMTLVAAGLIALAGAATAQPAKENKPATTPPKDAQPATPPDMNLPPGWTQEDIEAAIQAATPGPMHEFLARGVGTWTGKVKHWMAPDTEPMTSECTSVITSFLDGRFTRCEISGDMPGMGPFQGFGIYGFDNVSRKFQGTWVDNFGTGMMVGTGELSSDGNTLVWEYTYNCPIARKPVSLRGVERYTGKDTMTLEIHGADPKSGKKFKMMEINFTRRHAAATAPSGH